MKTWVTLHAPLLASMGAAILLATWGLRAALTPDRRTRESVLAAAGVLVAQALVFARFTVDDSFITFRFARNWASGLGPVFQAGERVEGYTSFLHMALLALARRAGVEIEFASKVLGLAASLAALAGVSLLTRKLDTGGRAEKFAPLLLSMGALNAAWTFAGLDAPLFAATLCWAAYLLLSEWSRPGARPYSGFAFGLLVLVRPEGLLFAAIAFLTPLLAREPDGRRSRRAFLWGLAFAAIAVPYWIWRWSYYGAFFPNTFYAKASIGAGSVIRGLGSLTEFFAEAGLHQVLLVLVAAVLLGTARAAPRFVLASLALFFAYVVAVGGDIQFLRFYVHVLPLWTACVAIGLDRVLRSLEGGLSPASRSRVWGTALVLAVPWIALSYRETADALAPEPHNRSGAATVVDVSRHIQAAHGPLGDWLRMHAPPGSRVAVTDIGIIAYRSGLTMIDLYGLTDRRIAHLIHSGGGWGAIAADVHERRPEFIALYGTSRGASLGPLQSDRAWLEGDYRAHSFWPDSPFDKGIFLLVREDVEVAPPAAPGQWPVTH
jgi:hypothetical protein